MTAPIPEDDFSRNVFCVLGAPVDQITMPNLVSRIHRAASKREPLFISTPNLNYLMLSQRDPAFRRLLLENDLCPAGGVGVLEKSLHKQNRSLAIAGAAPTVSRALGWCGLGHLKSNCSGT